MIKYLIAAALAVASIAAQGQGLRMKNEGGSGWICAGVGIGEREALAALEPQANFKLILVTATRGAYLAGVPVALYRAGSKTPLLSVRAGGPICLFHVPAGQYRVESTYNGERRGATLRVGRLERQPARIVLSFPSRSEDSL